MMMTSIKKKILLRIAGLVMIACSVLFSGTKAEALEIIYGTESAEETTAPTGNVGSGTVQGGVSIDNSVSAGRVSYAAAATGNAGVSIDYSSVVRANPSGQSAAGSKQVTSVGGSAWPGVLWLYLRTQNFSPAAAAAVLGNMERDSNFDPNMSGINGRGLFGLSDAEYAAVASGTYGTGVLEQTMAVIETIAPSAFERYTGIAAFDTLSQTEASDGNHDNEPYYIYWSEKMTLEEFKKIEDPATASEVWRRVMIRNEASSADIEMRRQMTVNYYDYLKNRSIAGADIILEAVRYVGNPYVYGGDDLYHGIDCSHYICRILTMTNHYVGEYMYSEELQRIGAGVGSLAEAEAGDVLCWDGHVAFYIAPGTIIHARSVAYGISLDGNVDIENSLGGLRAIRRVR